MLQKKKPKYAHTNTVEFDEKQNGTNKKKFSDLELANQSVNFGIIDDFRRIFFGWYE